MLRPTQEQITFYITRTNKHISRVQGNILLLVDLKLVNRDTMHNRAIRHDNSKFGKDEYVPYVYLSWYYKCKKENILYEYPEPSIKDEITAAINHHYKVNDHHPEYYDDLKLMSNEALAEMICDYAAMSQEFNNDLLDWINKNTFTKYKWTGKQKKFILKVANILKDKICNM